MDDVLAAVTSYPGIFFLCAASGTLVPVPEDLALLYAGIQIANGKLGLTLTLVAALSGVLLRDLIVYGVGYWFGRAVLERPWLRRFMGDHRVDSALEMVAHRGGMAVFIGRFMVGVRASVFLVAGAFGVRPAQFLVYDVAGLVIAVPLVVVFGYFVGQPAVDLLLWGLQHRTGAMVALFSVLALAVGAWWWWSRSRAMGNGDSAHP